MKASVMVSVIPIGVGISLSKYIVACERVFTEAGLNPQLHAHGTNVEGEWDEVFAAVRTCVETIHAMGAPRVSTHLKIGTRTDRPVSGEEMVRDRRRADSRHAERSRQEKRTRLPRSWRDSASSSSAYVDARTTPRSRPSWSFTGTAT